jgi:hypothetical protein
MSPAENQAIAILAESLQTYITENRDQHAEIKTFIHDVEARLMRKIEAVCTRMGAFETHCKEREDEVNRELAQRRTMFEAEIEAARKSAVTEAKAPSIYRQASAGLGRFVLRAAAILTALAVIGSATLAILEKLGLVGG